MQRWPTVLVVHGDPAMRSSLQCLLSIAYDLLLADGPEAALTVAASHSFELVITDLRLPRMSAAELTPQLRKRHPDLEFIWISGYLTRSSFDAALRLRVFDYVEIPFDLQRFLESIEGALQRGR